MKKLREITPKAYQCAVNICPAVYITEKGDKLAIVGTKVDNLEELGISEKVGENEQVVMIDKEILKQIFEK